MAKQLTGTKIKNSSSFETYIVLSINKDTNDIKLFNLETKEPVHFVLSRIVNGLATGKFCEITK